MVLPRIAFLSSAKGGVRRQHVLGSALVALLASGMPWSCGSGSGDGGNDAAPATPSAMTAAPTPQPTSAPAVPPLRLREVASGLDQPLFVSAPPGDDSRLFVVEQPGRVRIVRDGAVLPAAFLDISSLVSCCAEQGLLGLAFHPDYAANGRLFLDYTDVNGDTVIAEYGRAGGDPDRANPTATRIFLTVDQPFTNHNGGMVAFGPDGFLYIALGDGGGSGDPQNNAQDVTTKLGKILRIDVDRYPTPPPGNLPDGDPDIWDLGLRNPFRFSFDRATGDLYIGDVGQNRREEIDFEPRGEGLKNYGWNVTEGSLCFDPATGCDTNGITFPVTEYPLGPDCAVIGGYVYRGQAIPALVGRYVYGDFCSSRIRSFVQVGGAATSEIDLTSNLDPDSVLANISSFGEDHRGELYVVDRGGVVFRIEPE